MSLRAKHLKIAGVVGASALTVGTLLAAPAPWQPGLNDQLHLFEPLGDVKATAVYTRIAPRRSMALGQPLATTGTFTTDAARLRRPSRQR